MDTTNDFLITALSIHGKVYLCRGARRWTDNIAEGFPYKKGATKALWKAKKRFSGILKDIHLEQVSVAC